MVGAFLSVVGTEDFETAASFYDPTDLRSFRESLKFVEESEELISALYAPYFGNGATVGTVRNLSDAQFYAPFLGYMVDEDEMFQVDFANFKIVGSIREDNGLIHVLTRHPVWIADESVDVIWVTQVDDTGDRPRIKIAPEVAIIPVMYRQYLDKAE